jgi:hippurate hydrolase
MRDELRRLAESVAGAHGVAATVRLGDGTPPLVNEQEPVDLAREAVNRVLGPAALVPLGTVNLAAEDFAYYLEKMPGCFMRIGAREEGGEFIPAHSPRFYPSEDSIFVGATVLAECARVSAERIASR